MAAPASASNSPRPPCYVAMSPNRPASPLHTSSHFASASIRRRSPSPVTESVPAAWWALLESSGTPGTIPPPNRSKDEKAGSSSSSRPLSMPMPKEDGFKLSGSEMSASERWRPKLSLSKPEACHLPPPSLSSSKNRRKSGNFLPRKMLRHCLGITAVCITFTMCCVWIILDRPALPWPIRTEEELAPIVDVASGGPRTDTQLPLLLPTSEPHHQVINGLLIPNNASTEHPIEVAMRLAKAEWERKVARASKTLGEAVTEYRRRYDAEPPRGFDRWWAYAQANNVTLPDEYDQIIRDLEPITALRHCNQVRGAVDEAAKIKHSALIEIKDGRPIIRKHDGDLEADGKRIENQLDLLEPIAQWLPDMKLVFSTSDTPRVFMTYGQKQELMSVFDDNTCGAMKVESELSGLRWGCSFSTPANSRKDASAIPHDALITDAKVTMDLCQHPEAFDQHAYTFNSQLSEATKMLPIFSISKTALNNDILSVPYEDWMRKNLHYQPWEKKTGNKLFWRGATTGASWRDTVPWRNGQRQRLVNMMTTQGHGTLPAGREDGQSIVSNHSDASLQQLFDFGFTGEPLQCTENVCRSMRQNFDFGPRMPQEAWQYQKYIIDVDGNAWSSRFKRLMASGSLIFKSTIFPEWYTDRIQPWYHYVPVKLDYSELLGTMVYFEGHHNTSSITGHQAEAAQIAANAHQWATTQMRYEDMVAYMFRLYLEWGRLYAEPGQNHDYIYSDNDERRTA